MSNLVPAGEIVAENVSVEDYLAQYTGTETRYEWIERFVIRLAPNSLQHKESVNALKDLLSNYFSVKPIGEVYQEKGVKLLPHAIRVPDLAIVLDRFPESAKTSILSQIPAIYIEVVSPNSHERDTNDKKDDYQRWGMFEYWLIDPLTQTANFYRWQEGVYSPVALDAEGNYQTPLLPKLKIHVPTLWQFALTFPYGTWQAVQTMLTEPSLMPMIAEILKNPSAEGGVMAENFAGEDYLVHFAYTEFCYEWARGNLIQQPFHTIQHNELIDHFRYLLDGCFHFKSIGQIRHNFLLVLENSFRAPDMFVILNTNPHFHNDWRMEGAPDICIEVVGEYTISWDYEDKFKEYETAGVQEYWLIDPLTQRAMFYRLQDGVYIPASLDAEDNYQTPLLPKLKIHVPTLWQFPLPNIFEMIELTEAMFTEE